MYARKEFLPQSEAESLDAGVVISDTEDVYAVNKEYEEDGADSVKGSIHTSGRKENFMRDKSSSKDDSEAKIPQQVLEFKLRQRKASSPNRKINREVRQRQNSHRDQNSHSDQNSNSDKNSFSDQNSFREQNSYREVKSNSPRKPTTRKERTKSEATHHSIRTKARVPEPEKAMNALKEMHGYYTYLNRKYLKKIEELKEKCESHEKLINQLEKRGIDQRMRLDDAVRKNSEQVSKYNSLLQENKKLKEKNEDLEAKLKKMTRNNDELEMKYDEQVGKEKETKRTLDRAIEKIRELQDSLRNGGSREYHTRYTHMSPYYYMRIIEEKDKEINYLKDMVRKLQKKSISITNELKFVDTKKI